jgi:hypothetical protein
MSNRVLLVVCLYCVLFGFAVWETATSATTVTGDLAAIESPLVLD